MGLINQRWYRSLDEKTTKKIKIDALKWGQILVKLGKTRAHLLDLVQFVMLGDGAIY